MARKKVKLQWIANDSARRATLKKRKKGLMKKASELSTLCDVEVCAIVYSPNDPVPEVCPSVREAHSVLARFKRMSDIDQSKNMMNQDGFFRKGIAKVTEQLKKQLRDNRVSEITQLMSDIFVGKGLQEVVDDDLLDLARLLDRKLKEIHERIGGLRRIMAPNPHLIPTRNENAPTQMQVPERMEAQEAAQKQQWLVDMMNAHRGGYYGNGDEFVMPYKDNAAWHGTFLSRRPSRGKAN